MRVLYYNWADYLDPQAKGGGVSVYQKNLMSEWSSRPEVEAVFLSSGVSHELRSRTPYWRRMPDKGRLDHGARYEIVNSGVLAPSHHDFDSPAQIEDAETYNTFCDFVTRTGPYDVIHFNNLEGLPAQVLNIKEVLPNCRIILSLHNYYPVCPQVNLWHNEAAACTDFEGGKRCATCLPTKVDRRLIRAAEGLSFNLRHAGLEPGTKAYDLTYSAAVRLGKQTVRTIGAVKSNKRASIREKEPMPIAEETFFSHRRYEMIRLINTHCDAVLCVSRRVQEIFVSYGIDPQIMQTVYIGTRHARFFDASEPKDMSVGSDGKLTLGFLGYMRRDKGFAFLIEALAALPKHVADRINLIVAARRRPGQMMTAMHKLEGHLHSVKHIDGYTPDTLDAILAKIDLGVVPVLWEDNLPQVAIEMHTRHIPLLTSDMGGAQELAGVNALNFTAGDIDSFRERLLFVLNGKADMKKYWADALQPISVKDHATALLEIYQSK